MDKNTLKGRLKRYMNVSTAVGGLAARLAGEKYLGLSLDHPAYAASLKDVLGSLKGPLMKVAQLLASIPNALPEEYAQELQQLQSNAPPMGWLFVKRRMAHELGNDWQEKFTSFDQTAAAAASLGQVHKGVTQQGRLVACKLQYPGMEPAIEADLQQLKMAGGIYESFNKAIETAEIQQEIADRLREELDYTLEAKHMALYKAMLADMPDVHIPGVIPELSTKRLLTMDWLEGMPLLEATKWPLEKRNQLAKRIFKAWYQPFYRYGVIHGDPHLGNYSIKQDGTVNLLDFGCIRKFSGSFVQGVIDLYNALLTDNQDLAVKAYEEWGFKNPTKKLIEILNLWARFLYTPLLEDRVRRIEETNNSDYGKAIAEEVHKSLREIGGVRPPREFVFMDRAAVGVGAIMMHLQTELNWYEIFQELTEHVNKSELNQRQTAAFQQANICF